MGIVEDAFARRHSERFDPAPVLRVSRTKVEDLIPRVATALQTNGFPGYEGRPIQARSIKYHGRNCIAWCYSYSRSPQHKGVALYVDATGTSVRGMLLQTENVPGGEYVEARLEEFNSPQLDGIIRFLNELLEAERPPKYKYADIAKPT